MLMNVTFRQLQVFLAVVDTGSVSAAARRCHVTQPTVSMQLKELTEAVGMPLYEVVSKRLSLTAAGEELARTARAMSEEWAALGQRIDGLRGLTRGRLRVAVVSTAKYFMPRLLGGFCARYPEVDIALEVLNRDGVVQRLRENRDDLCIMSLPPQDLAIEQQSFLPNPLLLVAARNHPLASASSLPLSALVEERFILREPGSGTRLAGDAHFAAHGFRPRVRMELGSNEAIKQAVAGGLGLAVLSRHALGEHVADDGLVVLPVEHFPIHANWFIVSLQGKRRSPLAEAFLQYLADQREAGLRAGLVEGDVARGK